MRLYLVRHGNAVPKYVEKGRPLSNLGRQQVAALADFLREAEVRVQRVYHSGKLRAQQTAEMLATVVLPGGMIEQMDGLLPNDNPLAMAAQAEAWGDDVMLVGHNPYMEHLTARLTTGKVNHLVAYFETATAACFQYTGGGRWAIVWVIPPEVLLNMDM